MSSDLIDERLKRGDLAATYGKGRHAGALASAAWLAARGLSVAPHARWEVSIALDVDEGKPDSVLANLADTRLHIAIASSEWGFFFSHHGRASWIRVTDVPFVHERDDYGLIKRVPPLRELGTLVRELEERHRLAFRRRQASIRSTLSKVDPNVRPWVISSL